MMRATLYWSGCAVVSGANANSPGNRTHCYTELAVSSAVVAITIPGTHFGYIWRDD